MHLHIDWILLPVLLLMMSALLFLLRRTRVGPLLHEHIAKRPRRRLFIASVSFFLTFASVRGMVYCIVHQIPPFHYVIMQGRHIHHLVFGILILLGVGYGWLCEWGNGSDSSSVFASSLMSLLYGLGAALTLDEFALWLNLKDVYFVREGRSSIDAVILFGSLLAISAWGAPLFAALARGKTRPTVPARRP
jgi:hypothetical protein